jgi:predicted ABC-type ATPase
VAEALAPPCISVLAGTNGAGKSSIGGAMLRERGADYFNPDEAAARVRAANPGLGQEEANGVAWAEGKRLLEKAIADRHDFVFETTLGGRTMTALLVDAATRGFELRVWYAGLASPELHIARVRARVARGGHDIPDDVIRKRYDAGRENLIRLLPSVSELWLYDNSADGDPHAGRAPRPVLLMHYAGGRIAEHIALVEMPGWAKPIVAAAVAMAAA